MRPSGSFLVWLTRISSNGYLSYEEINSIFKETKISDFLIICSRSKLIKDYSAMSKNY